MNSVFDEDEDLLDAKHYALTVELPVEVLKPGLGPFDKWIFPAIKSGAPRSLFQELIQVQPLTAPAGQLLHLDPIERQPEPEPYVWYDADGKKVDLRSRGVRIEMVQDSVLITLPFMLRSTLTPPLKNLDRTRDAVDAEYLMNHANDLLDRISEAMISQLAKEAFTKVEDEYRLIGIDWVRETVTPGAQLR